MARVGGLATWTWTPQLLTVALFTAVDVGVLDDAAEFVDAAAAAALVDEFEVDDEPQPAMAAARPAQASRVVVPERHRVLKALRRRQGTAGMDDSSRQFFAVAPSGVLASASTLHPAFQPAMGRGL
jgi:hypothetical protein